MAFTIDLTFRNDALDQESRDAFAEAYGWQGAGDPRGGNRVTFREYCLREFVREVVRARRVRADEAGRESRIGDVDVLRAAKQ